MGIVGREIVNRIVPVEKIPSADIVDIAVAVIIYPVSRDFTGIYIDIIFNVIVVDVDAGIGNSHNYIGTSRGDIPCR